MEKRIHCQFVEEVIDYKKVSIDQNHGTEHCYYYKIQWKPTWEIESSLQEHCSGLVNKYWSTRERPKSPMEQDIQSINKEIISGNCTEVQDVMKSNLDQDIVIKEEVDIDIMVPIDSIMDITAPSDTKDTIAPIGIINNANDTMNNASKTQYNAKGMQNNLNVTQSNNTCKQNNFNLEQNTSVSIQNITTNTINDVDNTQNDNTFTNESVDEIESNVNNADQNIASTNVSTNVSTNDFQRLYKIHPVFSMDDINKPKNSTDYAELKFKISNNQRKHKHKINYKKIDKLKKKSSISDYVALKFLNDTTPDFTTSALNMAPCSSLSSIDVSDSFTSGTTARLQLPIESKLTQVIINATKSILPMCSNECEVPLYTEHQFPTTIPKLSAASNIISDVTQSALSTSGTKSNVLLNNENIMYITPNDIAPPFTSTTGVKYCVPLNTKKKLQLPIETKLTQVIANATVETKLTKVKTNATQLSIASTKQVPLQVQNPTFITPINFIETFQLPKKSQLTPIMYRLPATMSYRCFICLQNIPGNESTFEAHIAECKLRELKEMETIKPKSEVSLYQCKKCEFRGTFKDYKKHRLIHGGFKCDQCDYKGHTKKLLKNHKFTHQSVKRFKCSLCSYASHRREILKVHALIHDDNRPFACNQCEYKARDKYALKNHQDSHRKREERKNIEQTKELKYKCKLCEFSTNIKRPFDRHQARHLRELTFPCTQCESILKTELNLNKHIKKWHSKTATGIIEEQSNEKISNEG